MVPSPGQNLSVEFSSKSEKSRSKLALIRANWKDRIWWRDVALTKMVKPLMEARNDGIYVLDESWNNLIILDACRYDVFAESIGGSSIAGKLQSRTSLATDTGEFLVKNFLDRKCDDVVYVSASPFPDKLIRERVDRLVSVWRTHWSKEHETVLPEAMYECTLEAARRYPGKRIIAHFLQPHYPYIGHKELNVSKFESARPVEEQSSGRGYKDDSVFSLSAKLIYANAMKEKSRHMKAYSDNLHIALPYVEKLINALPGRTVITADHGEAFGEKIGRFLPIKVYGHMPCMRVRALTKVPWFVADPEQKSDLVFEPGPSTEGNLLVRELTPRYTYAEEEKLRQTIASNT